MEHLSRLWASVTQTPFQSTANGPPPGFQMPPLITAVTNHDIEATRDLLMRGADVNAKDDLDHAPLHYAAMSGNVDMVVLLLDHGTDIEARAGADKKNPGTSALTAAVASNEEGTAKILMARGATTSSKELTECGMANYIRWMSEDQFKRYRQSLTHFKFSER